MKRLIDLTLPIHEGMLTTPVPWHPPVEISILGRHELEGRATRKVTLGTHTGTHMDAPYHFVKDGATIDQIPPEVLVNTAVVLNVEGKGDFAKTTADDLRATGVSIPSGCGAIIHTGWYRRWMHRDYYEKWPCLTMDACEYLAECGVRLVGLDVPSPDDPRDRIAFGEISPLHYFFLSRGIVLVEFLANLDQIQGTEVLLIAAPLKVLGADGFPARVLAVEES
ncbi:MAG: cyclase family protein [Candidatus Brocadiaceae bacterium]|nr:cyclase family protein [Candidatus Brocadiaceae bacterium]